MAKERKGKAAVAVEVEEEEEEQKEAPATDTYGLGTDPYGSWRGELERTSAHFGGTSVGGRAGGSTVYGSEVGRAKGGRRRSSREPSLAETLGVMREGKSRPVSREESGALARWLRENYPEVMEEYAAHPYRGRAKSRKKQPRRPVHSTFRKVKAQAGLTTIPRRKKRRS